MEQTLANALEVVRQYFEIIIEWSVLLCEFIGVLMIVLTTIRGVIAWIRKDPHARLIPAEGIAVALTFKMGGEVLRTVTVAQKGKEAWIELAVLGAVVLLRAIMAVIIHLEIRSERQLLGDDKTKSGEEPTETPDEHPRKDKKKPKIINL